MEKFEKEQPENRIIDEVKDLISNSPKEIEKEFQETKNSWLACFGSRVFVIEMYLSIKKAERELGKEKYNDVQQKIETIKQRLYGLKQRYPDRNTVPPDEIKQELLEMLDVLK